MPQTVQDQLDVDLTFVRNFVSGLLLFRGRLLL